MKTPGFRSVSISVPAEYAAALSQLAEACGVSATALVKATCELGARRIAEQAQHQPQRAAAATFLQASAAITKRDSWTSLPGIELPATTVEAV